LRLVSVPDTPEKVFVVVPAVPETAVFGSPPAVVVVPSTVILQFGVMYPCSPCISTELVTAIPGLKFTLSTTLVPDVRVCVDCEPSKAFVAG